MIRQAVLGNPYACPVMEDSEDVLLYYKDAVRAADLIMQAPREALQMVVYNVGGPPVITAGDLISTVRRHLPGASITCAASSGRPSGSGIRVWDDSHARREWGWQPSFVTLDDMVVDFIREMSMK